MRYVSLDLETTGLRPDHDQILQVAMVLEDTDRCDVPVEALPCFTCLVSYSFGYAGQPYALALNADLLRALADVRDPTSDDQNATGVSLRGSAAQVYGAARWEREAVDWLKGYTAGKKITVAGKNAAGFDLPFIREHHLRRSIDEDDADLSGLFLHRVLDPGSVFFDPTRATLPSLADLKTEMGLGAVAHDALDDARDVIRVLRRRYAVPL